MTRPRILHRPMRPKPVVLAMAICAPLLAGCSGSDVLTPATLLMASAAVVINEDKTPSDLIASSMTGLDCDTIRKSRDKGPLCRPLQEDVIDPPVYCYKTLGKIDCFRTPDPYGYPQQKVN